MKNTERYSFGIECIDPEALRPRVLVSGLQLLTPQKAYSSGYGLREVIVPTEFRDPTDEELAAIIATPETPHTAKLVRVAASVGERAVAVSDSPDYNVDPNSQPVDFGSGIVGVSGKFRDDAANMINVSKDDRNLLVGDHIDVRSDPNLRAAIINLGPGARWHRVAPDFTAQPFDGQPPTPKLRNTHMRSLLESDQAKDLRSYSFLLDAPGPDAMGELMAEAFVQSPVTWYLHEGSTYGTLEDSRASFIISPPGENPWQAYPSIV